MNCIKRIFLPAAMIILLTNCLNASTRVAVFPFRGVGVGAGLIDAADVIFRGVLEEEGEYLPLEARELFGSTGCNSRKCAERLARREGIPMVITGELTRLGNKIIVRVRLMDVDSSGVEYSDEATASREDDLDIVLKRLGVGLSRGRKIEKTGQVGMITEQETKEGKRRGSFSSKGLRGGVLFPMDESLGDASQLLGVDFTYQSDTPAFFLAGRTGLRWGDNGYNIAILETKIGKYLGRGDFSPFISGGLGIDYFKGEGEFVRRDNGREIIYSGSDSATGLVLMVGAGFSMFRTYDFQFQLDIDYFFFANQLDPDGDGTGTHPRGISITFCIKR